MGRPKIDITPAICKQAEELAGRGLTKAQISASLGFCRDTLHKKEKEFPDFSDAIKKGRAKGISKVSNALFEAALSGNVAAMIFFLKNRSPESWSNNPQPATDEEVPAAVEVFVIDGGVRKPLSPSRKSSSCD